MCVTARLRLCLVCLLSLAAALPVASALADPPPASPAPKVAKKPAATLRYAKEVCGSAAQPIAFSPDGLLVMGCERGKVRAVRPLTGEPVWETAPIKGLRWLGYADASTLVAISEAGVVVVFDAASRAERLRWTLPDSEDVQDIQVAALTLLVTTHEHTLSAFSLKDGALLSKVTTGIPHEDQVPIQATALSRDGLFAAWALQGEDGATLTWASVKSLDQPTASAPLCASTEVLDDNSVYVHAVDGDIFSLGFSADSAVIAAHLYGDEQTHICLARLNDPTAHRLFKLEGFTIPDVIEAPLRSAIQLSADGARLRLIVEGGVLIREGYTWGGMNAAIIEVASGKAVAAMRGDGWPYDRRVSDLPGEEPMWAASFSAHGDIVSALLPLTGTRPLRVLPDGDLAVRAPDTFLTATLYGIAVGPNAQLVAVNDHQRLQLIDGADPKRPRGQVSFHLGVTGGRVSQALPLADGAGGEYAVVIEDDKTLSRWELGQRAPSATYTTPSDIERAYVGPTPHAVITCHDPSGLGAVSFNVVNTRSGDVAAWADAPTLPACPEHLHAGAHQDRFLFLRYDNPTKRWVAVVLNRSGEVVGETSIQGDEGWDVAAMSPDGQHLLLKTKRDPLRLLRVDDLKPASSSSASPSPSPPKTLTPDITPEVTLSALDAFAFSPNSQWLAVSEEEGGIQLVHIPSLSVTALAIPSPVVALAFAPDSATLHSLHPDIHSVLTWALTKP
jgi:WD40 repeat protein